MQQSASDFENFESSSKSHPGLHNVLEKSQMTEDRGKLHWEGRFNEHRPVQLQCKMKAGLRAFPVKQFDTGSYNLWLSPTACPALSDKYTYHNPAFCVVRKMYTGDLMHNILISFRQVGSTNLSDLYL